MKLLLKLTLISLLAVGCGDDEKHVETVETVNANPIQGSCNYTLSGRWYNWRSNRTVCSYRYTCNNAAFSTSYFGNINCPR